MLSILMPFLMIAAAVVFVIFHLRGRESDPPKDTDGSETAGQENARGTNLSIGISMGMCVGVAIGVALQNRFGVMAVSYGISFGLLAGVIVGSIADGGAKKK